MTWDDRKRKANLRDHGLEFANARDRFEWQSAIVSESYAGRGGSRRFMAVGWLDGRLVALVFSLLGTEAISAISLRVASNRERKRYEEA